MCCVGATSLEVVVERVGGDSYQGATPYQGSNSREIYILTSKRSHIGSRYNTDVMFSDPCKVVVPKKTSEVSKTSEV